MSRNYLSGAQKRKLALEKKLKESDTLSKVPKISTLFSAAAGQSTSNSSDTVTDEIPASDNELQSAESPADSSFENIILTTDMPSTSGEISEPNPSERISTDPALWNIETDKVSLQKYWLEKGR